jgi:phospholipase C
MTGKNIGDLLNAAGLSWGWFQGGFRPTTPASAGVPAVCNSSHTAHPGVPNPVAPLLTGPDIHTAQADYVSHHEPFMMYASTANPHHLAPTSVAAIGTAADQANHQYDTQDFFAALGAGNLPAVSFIKAPSYENGHPGNSDPTAEQNWVVNAVNKIMASPAWPNTVIFIAYDDSDGWYDHVNGPIVSPSSTSIDAFAGAGNCGKPLSGANPARCGHGPRLPLIAISPWAVPNYVDHTLTDQSSIINFVETNWSLGFIDGPTAPPNGQASFDRGAGTVMNMFDFNSSPSTAPLYLNCNGTTTTTPPASCP